MTIGRYSRFSRTLLIEKRLEMALLKESNDDSRQTLLKKPVTLKERYSILNIYIE